LVGIIHNVAQLPQNRDSSRRRPIRSGIDRLAQPLHGEFDVLRLQVAPALDLGLVAVLREALKVFRRKLSGSHTLPGEFFAGRGTRDLETRSGAEMLIMQEGPLCAAGAHYQADDARVTPAFAAFAQHSA
jgi:hypothetical protein